MRRSEAYLERGDGPAKAVLRANAEKQAIRQAIETQEELHRIQERVCVTLSAYEIGEELREENQTNAEQIKNAFVKDDAELEFVDDMTKLYLILSDPIAKRKYQQKVTIFVVGYENLCSHRGKLLAQLLDFFNQSTEEEDSFLVESPEFDFEEVGKNVREALDKAERTTERLANVSKEVLKVFDLVNPKDHKKGKKKLEKALHQSQQDVMNLTEKLVGVQSDLEDAKTKLIALNKQVEVKELDIERLKLQVNTNNSFEKECTELKKALEAKEQQLKAYRVQMDEVELSLSQAENKYDNYMGKYKNLKEENQQLTAELEKKTKEQQQKIMDIRKELEVKYDQQVNNMKEDQKQLIAELRQSHEEEVKSLREKLDVLRKSSASKTETSVTTPGSDDSALQRYSSMAPSECSQTMTWKSSSRIIKTITDLKGSVASRLNTAPSQISVNNERDSVLEKSSSLFVSMANTPTPSTPKTADTQYRGSRGVSSRKRTMQEISTQTDEIQCDDDELAELAKQRQVISRNDLQQIETQLSKTSTEELPQKMDEYKNKFLEIERQLQEEIVQWKLKFNSKAQTLNQFFSTHEKEMKEKEHLAQELSSTKKQLAEAEKEAEEAIMQLEELRAVMEGNIHDNEEHQPLESIVTENKSTITSASLEHQRKENQVTKEERLKSPIDLVAQHSVSVQCPSAGVSRQPSMVSLQYTESDLVDPDEEDGVIGVTISDSGFGGSGHVLPLQSPEESKEELVEQESLKPLPSPRVRSRLVRSALKDHRVITETIETYKMVADFKMDITLWLNQHGLKNKADLLAAVPDITLEKNDELDVLSKMPLIRDNTRQLLDALWQVTIDEYPWVELGMADHTDNGGVDDGDTAGAGVADCGGGDGNDDHGDHYLDDGGDGNVNLVEHVSCSPSREAFNGNLRVEIGIPQVAKDQQAQAVDKPLPRSPRTTPKGYTHLLHEYNNLNEEHSKLQQQLQDTVKSYQEQVSQNATVMNEMQETINNLRWQLLEGPSNDRNTKQGVISSVMFTRLDAERNVKSLKRAVVSKRVSQDSFNDVVRQMNQYVDLPGQRLAELVKRYRHHCFMKEVEENLYPSQLASNEVYYLQEKMEHLQKVRAEKWSEKMAAMSKRRTMLSDKITSSLNEIEESSGIFLIKPVYSYATRLSEADKSSHPIVCKKRPENTKKVSSAVVLETNKNPVYPLESSHTTNFALRQGDRPMWNTKDSHVSGLNMSIDGNPIPRLLAMDVNRITLNRNPVSEHINPKCNDSHSLSGVRQYVTVERSNGVMLTAQLNRERDASSSRHSLPADNHPTSSATLSHYATLPPINLPNLPRHSSAITVCTNQSRSSLSVTSSDENLAR